MSRHVGGTPNPGPPVFLVGAARSGTSLLYKCLCLHPDTAWISNWVRRYPGRPALAALNRTAGWFPRARHEIWFGGGDNAYVYGSPRSLVARAFPMPVEGEPVFAPERVEDLRRAVSVMVRAGGGGVFVSKRIGHNWRIPYLRDCFPDARFVEIVRDGRAVALSLSRVDWWDDSELAWREGTPRQWRQSGGDPWELCARNWVAELDAVAAGLHAVPRAQRLRVTYEDFVADPRGTLDEVARFAGLAAAPAWSDALAGLRFPDRNESWRHQLDAGTVRTIEAVQGHHLRTHGYAAV
ncbi:MAG: sulfotransferase family protein [Acidimicrobiia bacterium]